MAPADRETTTSKGTSGDTAGFWLLMDSHGTSAETDHEVENELVSLMV